MLEILLFDVCTDQIEHSCLSYAASVAWVNQSNNNSGGLGCLKAHTVKKLNDSKWTVRETGRVQYFFVPSSSFPERSGCATVCALNQEARMLAKVGATLHAALISIDVIALCIFLYL
jgi:hypothetical protein